MPMPLCQAAGWSQSQSKASSLPRVHNPRVCTDAAGLRGLFAMRNTATKSCEMQMKRGFARALYKEPRSRNNRCSNTTVKLTHEGAFGLHVQRTHFGVRKHWT